MTSFILTSLVKQANLGLKPNKRFKIVAINVVARARAASERFNFPVSDTQCIQSSWVCKKNMAYN